MKHWILAALIALCAVVTVATLRAAAQSVMTAVPVAPTNQAPATPAGAIHDDATVAPDKRQSADNNVSFPVDI
jgi:hypothetical protein